MSRPVDGSAARPGCPRRSRPAARRPGRAQRPADDARAQRPRRVGRLPVPAADRAPRRRRAAGEADARRRLRHRVGPAPAGPRRPRRSSPTDRCGWPCRRWRRPEIRGVDRLADLRALDTSTRRLAAGRHLRRPTTTATSTRRSCSRRSPSRGASTSSSARPPTTSSDRSPARRRRWCSAPSRSSATSAGRQSADLARELHRRRLEPADLPRGRPLAPTAGASRSAAAPPTCRSAPACRSCPCTSRAPGSILGKGMKRPEARQDHRHVRLAAAARAEGEEHPPLRRPHRAGRRRARRRGAHRLVVGPPAGRPPGQPRR